MAAKTNAELKAELKQVKKHGVGKNLTRVILETIRWGGFVLITYFAGKYTFLCIDALAGKTTNADINSNLANMDLKSLASILGIIFGALGIRYGRKQSKLRKDTVESLQNRIINLEKRLDPNRSSSRLTPRGDTRQEDRI